VWNRNDAREPLRWNLPHEIVVVGLHPEACERDE
jgi:hypothetical protein